MCVITLSFHHFITLSLHHPIASSPIASSPIASSLYLSITSSPHNFIKMFDNLLGNLQKQQEELQEKLAETFVEADAGDGAVTVKAGCDLHIENIKIDPSKLDMSDLEQVEDLVLVAVNEALDQAKKKAALETNKLLQGMMPPGMGDLGGMIGR